MCQPKPLARCSTHASKNLEGAEKKWKDAKTAKSEASRELLPASKEYEQVLAQHNTNHVPVTFGEEKWPEVAKASKKLKQARIKRDKASSALIVAKNNFKLKQFELDTSKEGYAKLYADKDAPERAARLFAADHGMAWQDKVSKLRDYSGNPLLSKEGKKSPETLTKLKSLHETSQRELNATYMNARKAVDRLDDASRDYTKAYDNYMNKKQIGTETKEDAIAVDDAAFKANKATDHLHKVEHVITMYRSQAEGLESVIKSIEKTNNLNQEKTPAKASTQVAGARPASSRLGKMQKVASKVASKRA